MKIFNFLTLVFISCLLLALPMVGVAQEVAEVAPLLPDWVGSIVVFLMGIPKVGPVIVFIIKWGSIVAAFLTIISGAIQGACAILAGSANMAGATKFAEKVKAISNKILPWFKYFSTFNVQKKK